MPSIFVSGVRCDLLDTIPELATRGGERMPRRRTHSGKEALAVGAFSSVYAYAATRLALQDLGVSVQKARLSLKGHREVSP